MTPRGEGATRYRSRTFGPPLLVTIVGMTALPGILIAWLLLFPTATEPPCTYCSGDADFYYFAGSLAEWLVFGIAFLAVWRAGMLIAGAVVGRTSRGSRLAFRAILVAVANLALVISIGYRLFDPTSDSFLDTVFMFLGFAMWFLIPNALGFGIGRAGRPRP